MPAIRPLAERSDRPALLALLRRCTDYALLERGRSYDAADLAEIMMAGAGDPSGTMLRLVLEEEGGLAGVAMLEFGPPGSRDADVMLLLLAPEARGQGHGARLLRQLVGAARGRACQTVHSAVIDANPRGLAFWKREGFVPVWTAPPTPIGLRRHVFHRLRLDLE